MQEIGGYFELELPESRGSFPHCDGIRVNSGYHALRLILRSRAPKHVWIPDYTCDIVGKAIEAEGIAYTTYPVDLRLEIGRMPELDSADDLIVVNNYFGLKSEYVKKVSMRFGENVIVDACQAWGWNVPEGITAFYSARKFLGVPDGGIARIPDKDISLERGKSVDRCGSLLLRHESGASAGYKAFKEASCSIHSEDVTGMSLLTERLLMSIDAEKVANKRRANYRILAEHLDSHNPLAEYLDYGKNTIPMVYPFMTDDNSLRERLIKEKIYVAKYWPDFPMPHPSDSVAPQLADKILPLPVDQRYGRAEMERILEVMYRKD